MIADGAPMMADGAPMMADGAKEDYPPEEFILDLQSAVYYVFTRAGPFFALSYFRFLAAYLKICPRSTGSRVPGRASMSSFKLAVARRSPVSLTIPVVVGAVLVAEIVTMPVQLALSIVKTGWRVMEVSVRGLPALITAVVVVFVTSDAWKILGVGYTPRFYGLVALFLLASLVFMIRSPKGYWERDIELAMDDESKAEGESTADDASLFEGLGEANWLLVAVAHRVGWLRRLATPRRYTWLMVRGAAPAPLEEPQGRRERAAVYLLYVAACAFALIVLALVVAGALILVGAILISGPETKTLAGSLHVSWKVPLLHLVISRQLLSLSLSLGALAPLFLLAGQHPEDRRRFMSHVLFRFRRSLVVYSVYRHAREQTEAWTGVIIPPEHGQAGLTQDSVSLRRETRRRRDRLISPDGTGDRLSSVQRRFGEADS
ncbi:MAG: hypothetical protein ACLQNG_12715 [Acidimicrobiales bacterium]|jgi:hypothetical protein